MMVSQCFFTNIFYIITATNKLNNRHKSTSKTKQTLFSDIDVSISNDKKISNEEDSVKIFLH